MAERQKNNKHFEAPDFQSCQIATTDKEKRYVQAHRQNLRDILSQLVNVNGAKPMFWHIQIDCTSEPPSFTQVRR